MKKITIIALLVAFLGLNFGFSAETATQNKKSGVETITTQNPTNIFGKIVTKTKNKVEKAKNTFISLKNKLKNVSGGMRTAIILIVVGLIIALLGQAVSLYIITVVGIIFFLVGALLLLFELL